MFDPQVAVQETNLIMKFLSEKYFGTTVPLRNAMTSGTPDTAAAGEIN